MPRIFTYNPTCEIALGNGTGTYQPSRQLSQFEHDMASLMLFIAEPDDFVVSAEPDYELRKLLTRAGFALPHFCTVDEAKALLRQGFTLVPWGKSAEIFKQFGMSSEAAQFDERQRLLHSRLTSVDFEARIAKHDLPDFLRTDFLPRVITTESEARDMLCRPPYVLKSMWSSSGRGVVIVREDEPTKIAEEYALSRLRRGEKVVCEPLLDRVGERSFLFRIEEDGTVSYLGINCFEASPNGDFGKELIGKDVEPALPRGWKEEAIGVLKDVLDEWHKATGYMGFIGFDSMIYNDNATLRLRLCTEANLRLCMGNVNLGVALLFAESTEAEWSILHFADHDELNDFYHRSQSENPLILNSEGQVVEGFFRLTPLFPHTRFVACGIAHRT